MSTIATKKVRRVSGASESYLKLVREFPLRPIQSEAEYERGSHLIDRLAVREENSLTPGEQDYLDALSIFIEDYDERNCPISEGAPPLENLKALMRQQAMRTIDLGNLLGSRGLASLILNGKRELSKAHIRLLAERFKVHPAMFI